MGYSSSNAHELNYISPVTAVAALIFLTSIILLLVGVFNYSTNTQQSKDERQRILDAKRHVLVSGIILGSLSFITLFSVYLYQLHHKRSTLSKLNAETLLRINNNDSFDFDENLFADSSNEQLEYDRNFLAGKEQMKRMRDQEYARIQKERPTVPSRDGLQPLKQLMRQQQQQQQVNII